MYLLTGCIYVTFHDTVIFQYYKLFSFPYCCVCYVDATRKPGPGAHSPEKVYVNKRAAPQFSMGIKHSEYICPLIIDISD